MPLPRAKIAVVVVNWNAGDWLRRCLESLATQERRPDRVIVVDNASADGSLDAALRLFPRVEAIRLDANVGFAAANNVALRACGDCDLVALLNPDAFAAPPGSRGSPPPPRRTRATPRSRASSGSPGTRACSTARATSTT